MGDWGVIGGQRESQGDKGRMGSHKETGETKGIIGKSGGGTRTLQKWYT